MSTMDGMVECSPVGPDGRLLRLNFGGGKQTVPPPPKPEPVKLPKMPEVKIPPPPPPAPPPPPPPTATSADIAQAEEAARADARKRRGVKSTVLAGETGGFAGLGAGTVLGNYE